MDEWQHLGPEYAISQVSLVFEDNHLAWLSESGFQLYLIELLDRFIEYRGVHGITPSKEGMVILGDGQITNEWLEYGSTHLTNPELQIKEGK